MGDIPEATPLVVVLAGPNGAGKSTAATTTIPPDMTYVNADEIAKTLPTYPSRSADLEVGRLALEELERLEANRSGFAIETTLAGKSFATRVRRLRQCGYLFRLVFVWAPSAEFCIARVAARVRAGGHDIPTATIRSISGGPRELLLALPPDCRSMDGLRCDRRDPFVGRRRYNRR